MPSIRMSRGRSFTVGLRSKRNTPAYSRNIRARPSLSTIDSIRFLGPDIAIEKGVAKVKFPKGDATAARYNVTHARHNGNG